MKRLTEAQEQFRAILAKNPLAREALRAQLIESYTRGKHEEVIEVGRKLLTKVIVDADVTLWMLRSMVRLKRKKEAAEFFVSWVASGTVRSFGEVQGFMVVLVADREQARALKEMLEKAIEKDPTNVNLLLYQSVFLAQVGMNVASWKAFHEAERLGLCGLTTGHRHAFARELLDRSMEPDEGPWSYGETRLETLKEKLAMSPDHGGLAMRIARVLDTSGRRDEALPYYSRVSKVSPRLWSSAFRQAQILLAKEEFEKAIPLLRQVLQISPDFAAGQLRLAVALAQGGKPEQLDEARAIVVGFGVNFSPERHTRRILEVLGRAKGGLEKLSADLAAAAVGHPASPYLHGHRALVLYKLGEKAEARKEALAAERLGLAGAKGHPHPLVFEVHDKPVKPSRGGSEKRDK
jgi:tetratricopeptide (TPR) repeat protein